MHALHAEDMNALHVKNTCTEVPGIHACAFVHVMHSIRFNVHEHEHLWHACLRTQLLLLGAAL